MKTLSRKSARAMTLIEVLMVLAALMLLAAIFLPTLMRPRHRHPAVSCGNNLKQIAVAFRVWAGDYGDRYPNQVSVTNGGVMELLPGSNAFMVFMVMSNELISPKLLICPEDSKRQMATVFQSPALPGQIPFLGNTNLSYFASMDAVDSAPSMFLFGDRNLTNNVGTHNGLLELRTNPPAGWTREMHVGQGNVGLADCSVQTYNSSALHIALRDSGVATNRLVMP